MTTRDKSSDKPMSLIIRGDTGWLMAAGGAVALVAGVWLLIRNERGGQPS